MPWPWPAAEAQRAAISAYHYDSTAQQQQADGAARPSQAYQSPDDVVDSHMGVAEGGAAVLAAADAGAGMGAVAGAGAGTCS